MSEPDGPLTNDGVRVQTKQCPTCIFRPGNLMQLRAGTVRRMIAAALEDDAAIICHDTIHGERSICRGFFDAHGDATLLCRLAHPELLGTIPT